MRYRFNPPPGWPKPPHKNWLPPAGWEPDPSWPPAPPNWQWYKKAGAPRWAVRGAVLGVLALGAGAYAYSQGVDAEARAPQVGQCARPVGKHKIVRANCTDPSAIFRVTSRVDGAKGGRSACVSDPNAVAAYSYKSTVNGLAVKSFVLCLGTK